MKTYILLDKTSAAITGGTTFTIEKMNCYGGKNSGGALEFKAYFFNNGNTGLIGTLLYSNLIADLGGGFTPATTKKPLASIAIPKASQSNNEAKVTFDFSDLATQTNGLYKSKFVYGNIMEIQFDAAIIDTTDGISLCASINGLGSLTNPWMPVNCEVNATNKNYIYLKNWDTIESLVVIYLKFKTAATYPTSGTLNY